MKSSPAPEPISVDPKDCEDDECGMDANPEKSKKLGKSKKKKAKGKRTKKTQKKSQRMKATKSRNVQREAVAKDAQESASYQPGVFGQKKTDFVRARKAEGIKYPKALQLWMESDERKSLVNTLSVAERRKRKF